MTTPNTPPFAGFAERFLALLEIKVQGNRSECARYMGVTPQAVSKWAAGEQLPRGDAQMEKLAKWLGTTASHLHYGAGEAPDMEAPRPKFILMFVDANNEVPLLNDFRMGTERGQKQLLAAARRMEKIPESERPAPPGSADN